MILRDYQEEAVLWLLQKSRGLIHAPAGSGKTRIAASALARRVWPGCRVHWIANTIEQRQQAADALSSTGCAVECSISLHCAASNPDVRDANILVVDELHHLPAESWQYIAGQIGPNTIFWGLTATPDHEDPERNAILNTAFPERFVIDRERLLASGHLVPASIFVHDVDVEGQYDEAIEERASVLLKERMRKFPYLDRFEQRRRCTWQATQEFLYENQNRNNCITSLASQAALAGKSTLLLVTSITHGEALAARIAGAVLIHSKVGRGKRKSLIEGFRDGTIRTAVCSQIADEGLDVPRADCLVLAAGGRSSGKLEQRVGRVLRPFEGKSQGIVHDMLDAGCQFAHSQCKARMRTYQRLGYACEIVSYK
jgi:superfamily II DNA or RNA helicase